MYVYVYYIDVKNMRILIFLSFIFNVFVIICIKFNEIGIEYEV